jgi:hypothetical protein
MKKPEPLIPLLLRRMYLTGLTERLYGLNVEAKADKWADSARRKAVPRHEPGLKALRAAGLHHDEWGTGIERFWVPEDYVPPTLADVMSHMDTGKSPAITELITYLILKGKCQHYYGHSKWEYELIHTLLCGVDWSKVSDPENETWAEFAGTECESDQESMTSVRLYCLCGYTDRFDNECVVGIDEMTIAQLLAVTAGEMRDQL